MTAKVSDLVELFVATKQTEGKSKHTLVWYEGMLGRFNQYLGDEATVKDVSLNNARAFVAHLQSLEERYTSHPVSRKKAGGLSPQTIHCHVRAVKVFGSWLYEEGFLAANPFTKLRRPKLPETIIEVLTDTEVKKMLDSLNPKCLQGARTYTICLLLLDTGIRADELLGLTLDNTDLATDRIKVCGKGNKERIVPIGTTTKKALLRWIHTWRPESGKKVVFLNNDGEPMTYTSLSHTIKRLGEKNGIPRLRCHLFRHTFAVKYLMNGGDLMTLRLLLGHTTISTTQIYLHMASQHLQVSHSKFSPVDRLNVKSKTKG